MTDSPDPIRRDPSREPATIEGEATVIDDGAPKNEASESEADAPFEVARAEGPAEPVAGAPEASTSAEPQASSHIEGPERPGDAHQASERMEPAGVRAAPAPRRSGFGSLLAASLLGGLLGAGAVLAYQMTRPAATPVQDPRIGQIQQQLGALPRGDALQALEARIAGLERARGEIDQRVAAAQAAAERAAARAEEALSRPASAAPPQAPDNTAAVGELTNRLAGLEGQLREAGTARQSLEQRIGEALQRLTALDQRLGEVSQQIPQLTQQVSGLSGRLNEMRPDAIRAGLRVVLADRLNDALAHGLPYPEILDSLRQFEAKPERIAALEPLAKSGAPTAASLAQSFKPVGERILRETRGESQGIGDRLLSMFDRVVTIRPLDEPGSGSPPALVARIENALERGALADAAAAWDSLPEPARRVSEEFGRQLKARVAADRAAREIATDAIAALNAPAR